MRREIINTALMETASAHAQHSLPVSPPTAPQTSSWQKDASLANTQLRRSLHLEQQLSGVRG